MKEPVSVLSLYREDLHDYMDQDQADRLKDDQLKLIAHKLADCLMTSFWEELPDALEAAGFTLKEKRSD